MANLKVDALTTITLDHEVKCKQCYIVLGTTPWTDDGHQPFRLPIALNGGTLASRLPCLALAIEHQACVSYLRRTLPCQNALNRFHNLLET